MEQVEFDIIALLKAHSEMKKQEAIIEANKQHKDYVYEQLSKSHLTEYDLGKLEDYELDILYFGISLSYEDISKIFNTEQSKIRSKLRENIKPGTGYGHFILDEEDINHIIKTIKERRYK